MRVLEPESYLERVTCRETSTERRCWQTPPLGACSQLASLLAGAAGWWALERRPLETQLHEQDGWPFGTERNGLAGALSVNAYRQFDPNVICFRRTLLLINYYYYKTLCSFLPARIRTNKGPASFRAPPPIPTHRREQTRDFLRGRPAALFCLRQQMKVGQMPQKNR